MIKLAVSGAWGRMGQTIISGALKDKDNFTLTTLLEHRGHPRSAEPVSGLRVITDNAALQGSDVLIEFTLPEATMENLQACVEHKVKMVIGTTGLTAEQINVIEKAAEKIPIVFASNMSIGVNVLFKLIDIAGSRLDVKRINISETHHVHKKDKPSGTAKTMAAIARKASGKDVEEIESFREGEVIGDHQIVMETEEDVLTIFHHAKDRSMFAKGALVAARFLEDKENGLYSMQDVLELA